MGVSLRSLFLKQLLIGCLLLSGLPQALALSPDCPIVSGKITTADGATSDPGTTGWSSDGSAVPNALYFAAKSKRFHAENLGGVGIWRSNIFSTAGYTDFQLATKIHSEGDLNSSEYVRVYYKINGGSEVLMAERTGNFGTLDLTSAVLTGNTVQFVIRIYNYDNGGSQTSKYYVEDYRVFRERGPCSGTGGTISVSASANPSVLTCTTSSTTLTASSSESGVTYSWTGPGTISNPNAATITVSTAGTYVVTGTNSTGTGSASVTVTENKVVPDLSATGGTLACGATVVLNASSSVSGATYRWTGPGGFTSTSRTPSVSTAGDYTVTVTNPANGCTASRTVSVTSGTSGASAFWLEDFTGLSNGTTSDAGATAWTSTTSGAGTFSVQNSKFMAAFNAGNTAEGVWTSASIDISNKSNVVLTVDLESGTATSSDAFEDSDYIRVYYKLNGGAETSFFSDISGLGSTTSGTATAVATSPALNGNTVQVVVRLKNSDPTERYYFDNVKLTGANASVGITASVSGVATCANAAQITTTLSAGTTVSAYAWTGPNGYTSTVQNPQVTAGGQYLLTATLSGGCTVQVPVTVTENKTAPDLTASGGSLACATSFTLNSSSAVANATYSWTGPNAFTSTARNPTVTAAGSYTVTVRNPANGCTTSQTVQVTAAPTSTVWLEDFTGLANGTISDAGATAWSRTTTGGTYAVQNNRFVNSNLTTAANTVGVWTSAAIPISGMTNVSFTVDVWSSVLTGAVMNGTGSEADVLDYLRVYYKLNGGSEVLVSEKPGAINNHSTNATVISSAAVSGSTLQIIIKARATGNDEFYYFDNVKVTAVTPGSVNASASVSGAISCTNPSVTLSGNSTTSGVTYSWTGPNNFTSSSQNPTVSVGGSYNLTVSTPAGCTGLASVTVVEDKTAPAATASVNGALSCTTTSVTLQGSSTTSGVTYRWAGPNSYTSTSQNPVVSAPGTYSLTVTNPTNGCSSAAQTVTVASPGTTSTLWLEDFSGLGDGTTSDAGTTAWSRTTTGGTYAVQSNRFVNSNLTTAANTVGVWTSAAIPISGMTNVSFTVDVWSSVLTGAVMNGTGSEADVLDYLRVYYKLNGGSEVLVSEKLGAINNHSTGATVISSVAVSGSTLQIIVKARATGSDEFYYFDNVHVTATSLGSISATASVSGPITCATSAVTLAGSSSTAGVTYGWKGPNNYTSSSQNPSVTVAGTYTLTVSTASGCTGTATVEVVENKTAPVATASVNGALTCATTSVTLQGSSSATGATYAWTGPGGFSSTSQNPVVSTPGVYTLVVTNPANGCVSTAQAVTVAAAGTATTLWLEDFTGLANGVTSDAGATAWSRTTTNGTFAVADGRFVNTNLTTSNINSVGVWTSAVIPISGNTNVGFTLDVWSRITGSAVMNGAGTSADVLDFLRVYYKLDGGAEVLVSEKLGAINNHSTTATVISSAAMSGATLQIIIKARATGEDEFYYFDNVKVTGATQSSVDATATVSGPITCSNTSVTLSGSSTASGVTYQWTGPGGFTSTAQNPSVSVAGQYTLTVSNGGCTGTATATVIADNSLPGATATKSGSITCNTPTVTLTGAPSATGITASYNWTASTGGGTITNPTSPSPTVSAPGTYTVVVKNAANGCTSTASVSVTEDTAVPAGLTATASGTITCQQSSVTLTASSTTAGVTYSWTGAGTITNPNTAAPTVSTAGNYTVTARNAANGCSTTKTVTVTQDKVLPTVVAGASGAFTCANSSVTLTATTSVADATYQWSGPGGFTSTVRNPVVSASGTYSVIARNPTNGCSSVSTSVTTVEDKAAPGVTATAGNLTCTTQSANLSGNSSTAGVLYNWTGPGGYSSTEKNPVTTVSGTYTLTVSNPANGCTSTTTVSVIQDNAPPTGVTATVSGPKTCSQGVVVLHGNSTTANVSYAWTGPFGFASTQQHPSAIHAGVYQLRVTNLATGCYALTTVMVVEDIISPADVAASASDDLSCRRETVTLTATSSTPGVNYYWSGPAGFNASTQSVSVSEPGDYLVIIEVPGHECAAELLSVTVFENRVVPEGVVATGGVLSCASPSVTLGGSSSTPGVSYRWTSSNGFSSTEQHPTVNVAGVYTLTVTHDETGCTATATATIGEGETSLPGGVTISGPGVVTCATPSAQLTASASGSGVTYQWTGPVAIPDPRAATIDITAAGTYTVTASVPGSGCSATASKTVTVNNTVPNVTATAQNITCVTSVAQLVASSTTSGATYQWSGTGAITNPTSATTSTSTAGNYTVTVTDPANGCRATAAVVVESSTAVPNAGTITSSAGFILTCYTNSITLAVTSTLPGATFTWMNSSGSVIGQSASQIVTTPDTYLVMVTNPANGCTLSRTRAVTQNLVSPVASVNASGSLSCRNPSVTLTGTSTGSPVTFAWSGPGPVTPISSGTTNASVGISIAGTYTLTLRTPAGCTATANTTVSGNTTTPAGVTATVTGGDLSCDNVFVTLTGASATAGVTYGWTGPRNFASTERETVTTVPGEYTLTVTNAVTGCTDTRTVTVGGTECIGN